MLEFIRKILSGRGPVIQPGEVTPLDFSRDLFRHGVYVLPCGGGVIPEPRRAIGELEGRYGREGLLREARKLLFEASLEESYPEGSLSTASGILYHLADRDLYRELVGARGEWLARAQEEGRGVPGEGGLNRRLERLQNLIGGISNRLRLPLPEGVPALDPQMEFSLFLEEC